MPRILPEQTDLYALTDSRLSLGRSVEDVASQLLNAGVKILQYREKKLPYETMLRECAMLRKLCDKAGACFIVDDHVDMALKTGADGVHIGQEDISLAEARRIAGKDMIIGVSTHSPEQAKAALEGGADYIGVGPIFPTRTKEDVVPPVGFSYLEWVAKNIPLPFVAIGGIKVHNIADVARHGANCCAMVSELTGSENIAQTVRDARNELLRGIAERER